LNRCWLKRFRNGRKEPDDLALFAAWIAEYERTSANAAAETMQSLKAALRNGNFEAAQDYFELSTAWHRLHRFVEQCKDSSEGEKLTLVVTAWFLRDLIQHLITTEDEDITYVTGERIGNVKTLSRICPLRLRKHSLVYAEADVGSCSDVELQIIEQGNAVHAMAHSHPGMGAQATQPSGIDRRYLGKIQHNGSEVIGVIVTRDGHVRFFTVEKPFRVIVQGSGVTKLEEYVFRVALPH
jgi:hypothetical protein